MSHYFISDEPDPSIPRAGRHYKKMIPNLQDSPNGWNGNISVMDWYSFEFYGGEWKNVQGEGWDSKKSGMLGEYRIDCASDRIMPDKYWADFFINYDTLEYFYGNNGRGINEPTSVQLIKNIKKLIREDFIDGLKKNKFNSDTKQWIDFDISHVFLQIRALMLTTGEAREFPPYVWQFSSGNPFDRVYRICRDYTKWKATFKTTKLLFDNVYKWESGKIFRENEENSKWEHPTFIEWKRVAKDFLSMKTKLKNENKGGMDWLKNDFSNYIKERAEFYSQFGEKSRFYIPDDIIEKCSQIK
jgi:hypothetical protein